MKRNLIQFTPEAQMYQNGHPAHWFLEINGERLEAKTIGEAAEKLINGSISAVASEQEKVYNDGIELKLLIEAMRSTIQSWYQLKMME